MFTHVKGREKRCILLYTGKGPDKSAPGPPGPPGGETTTGVPAPLTVPEAWKDQERRDCALYLEVRDAVFTISLCSAVFHRGIISSF